MKLGSHNYHLKGRGEATVMMRKITGGVPRVFTGIAFFKNNEEQIGAKFAECIVDTEKVVCFLGNLIYLDSSYNSFRGKICLDFGHTTLEVY